MILSQISRNKLWPSGTAKLVPGSVRRYAIIGIARLLSKYWHSNFSHDFTDDANLKTQLEVSHARIHLRAVRRTVFHAIWGSAIACAKARRAIGAGALSRIEPSRL